MIKKVSAHINLVAKERDYYRKLCKDSATTLRGHYTTNDKYTPLPVSMSCQAMSKNMTVHYSFDMAQQASLQFYWRYLSSHYIKNFRYTIQVIHCSQVQFTFWHPVSVPSLGLAAKDFHGM